jgi:hypothetical protein
LVWIIGLDYWFVYWLDLLPWVICLDYWFGLLVWIIGLDWLSHECGALLKVQF